MKHIKKNKIRAIFIETIPIILMIGIIPVFKNDYLLLIIFTIIIVTSFYIKYNKLDWLFFVFALIIMTFSEAFFISTGVETFKRNSLFNLMPIWLPVLWAYAFVVMRRSVKILEK